VVIGKQIKEMDILSVVTMWFIPVTFSGFDAGAGWGYLLGPVSTKQSIFEVPDEAVFTGCAVGSGGREHLRLRRRRSVARFEGSLRG
jgi:hypothetical protein